MGATLELSDGQSLEGILRCVLEKAYIAMNEAVREIL